MTNLLTFPQDLDNGVWARTSLDPMTNAVDTPDGNSTGWLMKDSAPGGTGSTRLRHAATTINVSTPHVLSATVRRRAGSSDWFYMAWSAGGIIAIMSFNINTGVIGVVDFDVDSALITADGDYWRCEMRFTSHPTDDVGLVDFRHASADGNTVVTLDGSNQIDIWEPKLEEGTVATPAWTPSSGGILTRRPNLIHQLRHH